MIRTVNCQADIDIGVKMASLYVFKHIPSGACCTIPAEWTEVGHKDLVIDEVEERANKPCKSGEGFSIIGCITNEPYPDDNWKEQCQPDKLPSDWLYDLYVPSYKSPRAKVEGLRTIPEKEADRNDFKRKGLL